MHVFLVRNLFNENYTANSARLYNNYATYFASYHRISDKYILRSLFDNTSL
jgi:hypothetical protein